MISWSNTRRLRGTRGGIRAIDGTNNRFDVFFAGFVVEVLEAPFYAS